MSSDWQETIIIDIPFYDIDLLEVVWHGHYLKYFECARGALLRKLDYDYPQMKESGYAWPVTDVQLRYSHPARYGMKIKVSARIREYDPYLKISYEVRDSETNRRLCKGMTTQVAIRELGGPMELSCPEIFKKKLGVL